MKYEIYSGAGNDFLMINNLDGILTPDDEKNLTLKLCGGDFTNIDGVIFIDKPVNNKAAVKMNFYNPDGSFGAMCGNGARCAAAYYHNYISSSAEKFSIEAVGRLYSAEILGDDKVRVVFPEPGEIKLDFEIDVDFGKGIRRLNVNYVNVGSDHLVIFLDEPHIREILGTDVPEKIDINFYGKILRYHNHFQPRGVNVNFVSRISDHRIRLRTYERGVERETLACGTGVISSSICAVFLNKAELPLEILVQSGELLEVNFIYSHSRIMELSLSGSAKKISEGIINDELY